MTCVLNIGFPTPILAHKWLIYWSVACTWQRSLRRESQLAMERIALWWLSISWTMKHSQSIVISDSCNAELSIWAPSASSERERGGQQNSNGRWNMLWETWWWYAMRMFLCGMRTGSKKNNTDKLAKKRTYAIHGEYDAHWDMDKDRCSTAVLFRNIQRDINQLSHCHDKKILISVNGSLLFSKIIAHMKQKSCKCR